MAPGGYAWWYLDALSDDGRHGLVIIAFLGSVFSPYYAFARRRDAQCDPLQHNAVNVSLYSTAGKRWSMTERDGGALRRGAEHLQIGPSVLEWRGDHLELRFDERCAPWPSRVRGVVRLFPDLTSSRSWPLDRAGRHHWRPLAPRARVELRCSTPELRWQGRGYLDCNHGEEPLERAFAGWQWSRAIMDDGGAAVLYDAAAIDGAVRTLALRFRRDGGIEPFAAPRAVALPPSAWKLDRSVCTDPGRPCAVHRTLEDGPFYVRSLIDAHWQGRPVLLMHESLSLRRFASRWVQALLPFRMPRRRS